SPLHPLHRSRIGLFLEVKRKVRIPEIVGAVVPVDLLLGGDAGEDYAPDAPVEAFGHRDPIAFASPASAKTPTSAPKKSSYCNCRANPAHFISRPILPEK